jgi:hypothetical protein
MERELTLDTLAGDHTSHGEHLARTTAAPGDDRAGEDLDAFLLPLEDLRMNVHRIPDLEFGYVFLFLQTGLFDQFHKLVAHDHSPFIGLSPVNSAKPPKALVDLLLIAGIRLPAINLRGGYGSSNNPVRAASVQLLGDHR